MIDWLTIFLALIIIAVLVGIFGFAAWKINENMSNPMTSLAGKSDEKTSLTDSGSNKSRKAKNSNESSKKKRNNQKKSKSESKGEEEERHSVTFKEPSPQASEDTDNEPEDSEQEAAAVSTPAVEVVSTTRRRQKNKNRATGPLEGILANKDEKSPTTSRAPSIPHPKLATMIPKDEVELARQHHQQPHSKSNSTTNKQSSAAPTVQAKKSTQPSVNAKQEQLQNEQPFTTVGNRNKAVTPPLQANQQPQQPQQQNKSANSTSTANSAHPPPQQQQQSKLVNSTPAANLIQQSQQQQQQQQAPPTDQPQHEQLPQRQPNRSQKEATAQVNGFNANSVPAKQQQTATIPPTNAAATATSKTMKVADIIKALPTSQAVVGELMQALDAYPLSSEELTIVMHKIANKQSVVRQDWSKLQHGQKVDPQAQIGQIRDESAKAYEEDMKTNASKRLKELNDELNNEKRRINDILQESNDKDSTIKRLHAQLDALQHQPPSAPAQYNVQQQQHQIQQLQIQLQRITDENIQLNKRLAQQQQQQQQQHFQQQQQLTSANSGNASESESMQVRVFSEQSKKLSIQNAELEKLVKSSDASLKQAMKDKEGLTRTNQQLTQRVEDLQRQFQQNEEKLVNELKETRTSHMNQTNEYKRRIEQLQNDNEQLRREEIVHVEATQTAANDAARKEENQQLEKEIAQLKETIEQQKNEYQQLHQQLMNENQEYKKQREDLNTKMQNQENDLRQEIDRLKQEKTSEINQQNESMNNELKAKNAQIESLQKEIEEIKATNDSLNEQVEQRLQEETKKQKNLLRDTLPDDLKDRLDNNEQNFDQWFSSYRQLSESAKNKLQEESAAFKHENDRLHQNMREIETQLKDIEKTVKSKEESLLTELKYRDATIENVRNENEQLVGETQRLRNEIERLNSERSKSIEEFRSLQLQLDDHRKLTNQSPSSVVADLSEFVSRQSQIQHDALGDELTELIQSTKEALENQDSVTQQMDKVLSVMQRSGFGETSTSHVDDSTVSSEQQQ